jgi:hypothetical protein
MYFQPKTHQIMHKFILTIGLIVFTIITVKAQTNKGTIYLGGSVSYVNTETKSGTVGYTLYRQLTLMPTVGIFLNSKWAIGITPTYQYLRDTSYQSGPGYTQTSIEKTKLLGGGVNVRYYVKLGSQFAFFPQLAGTYLTAIDVKATGYNERVYQAALSPNFAFFPTPKIAINMAYGGIRYQHQTFTPKDGSTPFSGNTFDINANGGITLGVAYHFSR